MNVRIALFALIVALVAFSSVAEKGPTCIDPLTATLTNSVPCSVARSDPGTVLLCRNPQPLTMAADFESRFCTSAESNAAAYDPLWRPGFMLFLR